MNTQALASKAADAVGVTPHSDMRLFVEQAVKWALNEAALSAAEPVAWVDEQELRYLEMVSGNKAWADFQRNIKVGGKKEGRAPLYAAPLAPSMTVKALSDLANEIEKASVLLPDEIASRIRLALSAQVQDLAAEDVLSEVRRQVEVEGWSADHDDAHDKGEMAGAAACYALEGVTYTAPDHYPPRKKYAAVVDARNSISEKERETTREAIKLALGEPAAPRNWPWHASWWKPTTTRRNLVKAAALLISEIKRLDRAASPAKQDDRILHKHTNIRSGD